MNLYIVIQQPDGSWEHLATIDSVWNDPDKAEGRRAELQRQSPSWPAQTHIRVLNQLPPEEVY